MSYKPMTMPPEKVVEASTQPRYGDTMITAGTMQPQSAAGPPPPSYDDTLGSPDIRSLSLSPTKSRLTKPIAIPATTSALGSPFLRCYAPILSHYNIPRDAFLRHLDSLNRVAVANPPLQILKLSADIVSFVPLATAQIVGASVSAASAVGTQVVSKGRTEMYLRDLNRDVFGPRGLRIEIADMKAMAKLTDMPVLTADGKLDKRTRLLDELEPHEMEETSVQQRRLCVLQPWIEELEIAPAVLPDVHVPESKLSQITAKISERNRAKEEKKLVKERGKGQEDYSKDMRKAQQGFDKEMRKLDEEEEKVTRKGKKENKQQKELDKIARERDRVIREYEKGTGKVEKDTLNNNKEEKEMRKTKWLIIRNADDYSGMGPNHVLQR